MNTRRFLVLCGICCLFAPAGYAQTIPVVIKAQAEAPVQITAAHCSVVPGRGEQCGATLNVSSKGTWTAYGLKWTLLYENGVSLPKWSTSDATLGPHGVLKPGVREHGSQGGGTGLATADKNLVALKSAEVEVDFVVGSKPGSSWGNTQSKAFDRVMAFRFGHSAAVTKMRSVYKAEGMEGLLRALGVQ